MTDSIEHPEGPRDSGADQEGIYGQQDGGADGTADAERIEEDDDRVEVSGLDSGADDATAEADRGADG